MLCKGRGGRTSNFGHRLLNVSNFNTLCGLGQRSEVRRPVLVAKVADSGEKHGQA